MPRLRVGFVINCPAPYRNGPLAILAGQRELECRTFFCTRLEPIRNWHVEEPDFDHVYLKERFHVFGDKVVHSNPDIWPALRRFRPDIVITAGFNPTHQIAYLYSRLFRARHIAWTDGTAASERILKPIHRFVRRHVYARSHAYVGASNGSIELYRQYRVPESLIFKAHLATDNRRFAAATQTDKRFDFIFSGRFTEVKNPLFAIDVARGVADRLGRTVSIAFVGAGALEPQMRAAVPAHGVDAHFLGFAQQHELPSRYASSRVLLFPTTWDPWGVVANEACAAGLPVIVSPMAGAANELVVHERNGYVLPLEADRWIESATRLLGDPQLYQRFSAESMRLVGDYTFENAAKGLLDAIQAATGPTLFAQRSLA